MGFYISYELEVKILLFLYEYPIDPAQLIEKIILSPNALQCSLCHESNIHICVIYFRLSILFY